MIECSATGRRVNALLDAIPCSWSNCYSNTLAKSVGLAINSDSSLLSFNGTYWSRQSNSSNFLKNHTITGNSYTTNNNEALKPSSAIGWARGVGLWYDTGSTKRSWSSAIAYCLSKGWRLPELNETKYSIGNNGVPSYSNSPTYTITWAGVYNGNSNHYWTFTNSSKIVYFYTSLAFTRCVK